MLVVCLEELYQRRSLARFPFCSNFLQFTNGLNLKSAWWDEHVAMSVNQHDYVDMGRNNVLKVLPRLTQEPHNLKPMTPFECGVGGLARGENCYGLYNKSWDKREVKVVPGEVHVPN